MGYYDDRQLPFYWDLARRFTLVVRYFQPMFGPTIPNRLFSFAGTNAGLESNLIVLSNFDGLTIFDQLAAKGVSWRYYHEPSSFHAPLPLYFKTLASNRAMLSQFVPLNRLFTDVQAGDVAQVTYVDPADSSTISEHPSQNVSLGESWTKHLIDLINQDPKVMAFAAGLFDRIRLKARVEGPAGNGIEYTASANAGGQVIMTATTPAMCCANLAGARITPDNPAQPGETITVYATGLGTPNGAALINALAFGTTAPGAITHSACTCSIHHSPVVRHVWLLHQHPTRRERSLYRPSRGAHHRAMISILSFG